MPPNKKYLPQAHRTTAHICSAPFGRSGFRHIFTAAMATVKTSYMPGTLTEMLSEVL